MACLLGRHDHRPFSTPSRRRVYRQKSHFQQLPALTSATGDEYISLHLCQSNTDQQHGGGVLYVGHAHHAVCAVFAVNANLQVHHARPDSTPSDPLFQFFSRLPLARGVRLSFLNLIFNLKSYKAQVSI